MSLVCRNVTTKVTLPNSATPENSLAGFLQPVAPSAPENLMNTNKVLATATVVFLANPIGVDTVNLTVSTNFCKILPTFNPDIQLTGRADGTFTKEPCILWTDTTGRVVYADKAIINTDNYQLTIRPCGNHANILINFSARAFAENNIEVMDAARIRYVTQRIQDELAARGLICDLFNEAHVRRVDVARNIELEHDTSSYIGIYKGFVSRDSRQRLTFTRDTYLRVQTPNWQAAFYDKGQEQNEKAAKTTRQLPPTNQLRGEVRFMKSAECAKRFDVKKLRVTHLLKPETFATIPELYREMMSKTMFELDQVTASHMTMSDEDAQMLARVEAAICGVAAPGSREYYRYHTLAMKVAACGFEGTLQWFAEKCAPDNSDAAKRARQRFKKDLLMVAAIYGQMQPQENPYSRDELYDELRAKILDI